MARRRGKGGGSPTGDLANNPDGLGVGALAEGELQHGERGIVESISQGPPPGGGGGPAAGGGQQAGPIPGSAVDLWGPTGRPEEPITAGVDQGPGGPPRPEVGDADAVDLVVRQAFAITGSPHLMQLLDRVVR